MNTKYFGVASFVVTLSLVLSACRPGQLFGPPFTPTPFSSPAMGQWSGKSISFSVLENEKISNFFWVLNATDTQNSPCPIQLNEELPFTNGVADLTFTHAETGEVTFSIKVVFDTETSASLSYEYTFCPSTRSVSFDPSGNVKKFTGEATAEWVKP